MVDKIYFIKESKFMPLTPTSTLNKKIFKNI